LTIADDREICLEDVREARRRIAGLARRTPLKPSLALSRLLDRSVHLKLETLQDTGAFKLRGAASMILRLPEDVRSRGVVTMSSGNHGRAVAWVAHRLGVRAVVCLSTLVPAVKVEAIRELGAEVVVDGDDQNRATERAHRIARERGLTWVHPFDDPDVIAGQGTLGIEILEDRPGVDTLVVPVGGGGLIAGIAVAVKALKPDVRIVGVTNDRGAAMYESLRAGRIVDVEEAPSLADALPGAIPPDNRYTFRICRELVEEIFLVGEDQIAQGMAWALLRERVVLEGGAATGIALLLDPRARDLGREIAVVCTGDNVDVGNLLEITRSHAGRLP
jgi:threonine dehydratase